MSFEFSKPFYFSPNWYTIVRRQEFSQKPSRMTSNYQPTTDEDNVVKETATHNWKINGFSYLTNYVGSEEFSPPNSRNKFKLYLKSKTRFFNPREVCLSLYYYQNEPKLLMRYRVSIVNANGEKLYTQENYWKYCQTVNNRYKYIDFLNLISYDNCLSYLVNGNLMLICEVDVLEDRKSIHTRKSDNCQNTTLEKDLQELLENSKLSDFALLVKGKEFKVHKAILAARSKVFEAMFSADLEEKKQNRVEITDVEVDVFEHLLRYIYTGKIAGMDEYGLELFVAADKYQLDHLKSICEQSLGSNITIESVVNVLVIADMHNASELKSKCIEYITSNSDEVKRTDAWKQMKSRPALLMELFDKLSFKMKLLTTKP